MKKEEKNLSLWLIPVGALVLALCICIYQIAGLRSDVNSLKRMVSDLEDQIEAVDYQTTRMAELLEEQENLFSSVEYTIGEFDRDSMTTAVKFTLVPKVLSDDMTLSISMDGENWPLERAGDSFRGTVYAGIFQSGGEQPMVSVTTQGMTQTQELENVCLDELWRKILPNVNVSFGYTCTQTDDTLVMDGEITIHFDPVVVSSGASFTKFEYVTYHKGQEISREDITQQVLALEALGNGVYQADFKETYACKAGESLELYLEATDSLGYLHRHQVFIWYTENGAVYEGNQTHAEEIYDSDGNLLFIR